MNVNKIKPWLSIIAFASAIIIGFIALFLPPEGIIDSSVLFFTSQLLVFVASIIGIDFSIGKVSSKSNDKA